ncbi:MAG: DUF3667 domain-containing protein [Lysobacterales bacterium]
MSEDTGRPEAAEKTGEDPLPATDPKLSLARKKLAGSAVCLNCGTPLKGPYCYFCGQPDRNFVRFFPALVRDLMEDFLDLDSRFIRTFKPLLFHPGRLTRDFLSGRRYRYTPPLRLYMFLSIAFFLLAALFSTDALTIDSKGGTRSPERGFHIMLDDKDKAPIDVKRAESGEATTPQAEGARKGEQPFFDTKAFQFNGKPWDRETNPVAISWLPRWINDRINDEIEHSPEKAEEINKNPDLIIDKVFDILPVSMFILLPVVALIFKFWYLFSKRYYVEHLIFALHNHAFLFVCLILILLLDGSGDLLNAAGHHGAAAAASWAITAIAVWIPIYLLVSLRTVYRQGWMLTLGKFTVIGISYLVLLSFFTIGVTIASFVLL